MVRVFYPTVNGISLVSPRYLRRKKIRGWGWTSSVYTDLYTRYHGWYLRAYRIATTLDTKPTRDSSERFELMAYPQAVFSEPVFLQALLQNWQARKGQIDNQRAAFCFLD